MVNDRQKYVLTVFSLMMVIGAAGFFIWLAAAVATGDARGDSWPGKFLMLLIYDWNSLPGAFKGLAAVIAGGLASFGTHKMKDWLFYVVVAFTVLGFFASAYLFFEVTSVSTAKNFWAYSPTDRLDDYLFRQASQSVALSSCAMGHSVTPLIFASIPASRASHSLFRIRGRAPALKCG